MAAFDSIQTDSVDLGGKIPSYRARPYEAHHHGSSPSRAASPSDAADLGRALHDLHGEHQRGRHCASRCLLGCMEHLVMTDSAIRLA